MFREWIRLLLSYPPGLQTATQAVESLPKGRAFLDQRSVSNECGAARRRPGPARLGCELLRCLLARDQIVAPLRIDGMPWVPARAAFDRLELARTLERVAGRETPAETEPRAGADESFALEGQRLVEPRRYPDAEAFQVGLLAVTAEIANVRSTNMALVESRTTRRDGSLKDRIRQARDEAMIRAKPESRQGVVSKQIAELDTQAIRKRGFRLGYGPPIVEATQRVPYAGDATDDQFHRVRIEDLDSGVRPRLRIVRREWSRAENGLSLRPNEALRHR